jgi:hypothetical protein
MARKTAIAGRKGAAQGQWGTGSIILATVLAVATLPVCMVLAIGMLPTLLARIFDRTPPYYRVWSVGALNFAGLLWPVFALLHSDLSLAGAAAVLSDPRDWLVIYGGAALGGGLYEAMPVLASSILEHRASDAERKLQRRAEQIFAEWGNLGGD